LLHTAAYCGLPTARSAIKLAARVLNGQPERED
jgi:alkylhydroperoxidase/carboxymuconolactone decarboxylase family protein YurZ